MGGGGGGGGGGGTGGKCGWCRDVACDRKASDVDGHIDEGRHVGCCTMFFRVGEGRVRNGIGGYLVQFPLALVPHYIVQPTEWVLLQC